MIKHACFGLHNAISLKFKIIVVFNCKKWTRKTSLMSPNTGTYDLPNWKWLLECFWKISVLPLHGLRDNFIALIVDLLCETSTSHHLRWCGIKNSSLSSLYHTRKVRPKEQKHNPTQHALYLCKSNTILCSNNQATNNIKLADKCTNSFDT